MKRIACILLSALLLLPAIASFGVGAAAESTYDELWQEKLEYESDPRFVNTLHEWEYYHGIMYGVPVLPLILYTEKCDWTYVLEAEWEHDAAIDIYWRDDISYWLHCKDLNDYVGIRDVDLEEAPFSDFSSPRVSWIRKMFQSMGITLEDWVAAFQKMKDDPHAIRDNLACLTDEEFERFVNEQCRPVEMPPNFILQAMFMEDDVKAESLLAMSGNVYIPELGCTISVHEILKSDLSIVEKLMEFDLTTKSFEHFLDDTRYLLEVQNVGGFHSYENGFTILEQLESAREAQLAAKETGDSAVTSVLVLALALSTLGAVVLAKKKRKI